MYILVLLFSFKPNRYYSSFCNWPWQQIYCVLNVIILKGNIDDSINNGINNIIIIQNGIVLMINFFFAPFGLIIRIYISIKNFVRIRISIFIVVMWVWRPKLETSPLNNRASSEARGTEGEAPKGPCVVLQMSNFLKRSRCSCKR